MEEDEVVEEKKGSAEQQEIKDLLKRLGWSQSYAGRYLGVTPTTVSFWVTGRTRVHPIALKCLKLTANLIGV